VEGEHFLSCDDDPDSLAELLDFWLGPEAPSWAPSRLAAMAHAAARLASMHQNREVAALLTLRISRERALLSGPVLDVWHVLAGSREGVDVGHPLAKVPSRDGLQHGKESSAVALMCVLVCLSLCALCNGRLDRCNTEVLFCVFCCRACCTAPADDLFPGIAMIRAAKAVIVKAQSDMYGLPVRCTVHHAHPSHTMHIRHPPCTSVTHYAHPPSTSATHHAHPPPTMHIRHTPCTSVTHLHRCCPCCRQ
jgi:hypothetical protein